VLCRLAVASAFAWAIPAFAADLVTVGAASTTSDAPIYIADKKGYFREEGLEVKVTNFRSAADMVAPLATGQLDAGAGSASAGLYNAVSSGIKIKIVADKASSAPGYGATKILVRKDHVERGRYKTLADLKGMKFAMNAPGVSNTATLNALLKSVDLKYSDVDTVNLPFPDHVTARIFQNRSGHNLGRSGGTAVHQNRHGKSCNGLRRIGVKGFARELLPLQVSDGSVIEEQIRGGYAFALRLTGIRACRWHRSAQWLRGRLHRREQCLSALTGVRAPARVRRRSRHSRQGAPGWQLQGLDDHPALAQTRALRHHGPVRRR
jgi:hypothetical protein